MIVEQVNGQHVLASGTRR